MNLRDAWRISKRPYIETTYRSTQLTRGGVGQRGAFATDPSRQVRSAIRSSRISKMVFAIFICIGAAFPLLQYAFNQTPVALAASVTFSLAIVLAYIILYSLQVLPSFSSADPFALLSTLPFTDRDFSLVAMFSFLRTFDYLVVGAVITQTAVVGVLTGSAVAAVVMLVASLVNVTFAVAIALWLAGLFYRSITRGGRSKGAALARMVILVTWGLAAMSTGFLFSLIGYFLPAIDGVLAGGLHSSLGVVLAFVHPFTAGLVVAEVVFNSFLGTAPGGLEGGVALVLSSAAVYVVLAFLAGRRTLGSILSVAHGQSTSIIRQAAKEFRLTPRRPMVAYVLKDLRVASKTPSMAIVFALPIFVMLIIALNASAYSVLRATSVLYATLLGCFFIIFSSSVLLGTEGVGLDYTMSLPLGPSVIIDAKSLVATASYIPVPFIIAALMLVKGSTSASLAFVPFIEIMAVAAAAMAQLTFFIKGYVKRNAGGQSGSTRGQSSFQPRGFSLMSGGDLVRMGEALVVAGALILGPMVAYVATYYGVGSHPGAVVAMAAAAVAELAGVRAYVMRM